MKDFILCCVSSNLLSPDFMADLKEVLSSHKITLSHTEHLTRPHLKALNLTLNMSPEIDLKKDLLALSLHHKVDMALIPQEEIHPKKLIVFDMDSTLIQQEVINEMARKFGIGEKVAQITERAMNGELNFDESLKLRVSLLKGLKRSDLESIVPTLKLSVGVEKLIKTLKEHGYKTAILSGGFQFFADHFKQKLSMDYAFANHLEWDGDTLTGKVTGEIINGESKARLLKEIAQKENILVTEVVAVGDGANDLPMLATAGMGIAYHAKETVRKEARYQMNHSSMETILYFLGISGEHFDETL